MNKYEKALCNIHGTLFKETGDIVKYTDYEILKGLVKKSIPNKVIYIEIDNYNSCPSCHTEFQDIDGLNFPYCKICGQALDWN